MVQPLPSRDISWTRVLGAAALVALVAFASALRAQSYQLRAQPAQSIYVDEHYRPAAFSYTVNNVYYDRADTLYSPPFTSRVYLSEDRTLDAGDRLLFERRDRILSTVYVSREMDLPGDIPRGSTSRSPSSTPTTRSPRPTKPTT